MSKEISYRLSGKHSAESLVPFLPKFSFTISFTMKYRLHKLKYIYTHKIHMAEISFMVEEIFGLSLL